LIPEKQARVEAERSETEAQAKARVERSLAKIRSAMAGAKSEAEREAVEERVLSEIDTISEDMKVELEDAMKGSPTTDIVKKIKVIEGMMGKLDAKVKAGLSVAGMIAVAGKMLMLEARVRTLLKSKSAVEKEAEVQSLASLFSAPSGSSAPPPQEPKSKFMVVKPQSRLANLKAEVVASEARAEPPSVPYQQQDTGRQTIEIAGLVVKPNGAVKTDVYGVDGLKIDKYSPLEVLEKNKARVKALPTKTPNRAKVMAQIQRFIDNHEPLGKPPKLPKGFKLPKAGGK
jgi:hypothetical protein